MKWKLSLGIFLLFTGFLTIAGIGLLLLHMWDEYKIMEASKTDRGNNTYINEDVIEEFR